MRGRWVWSGGSDASSSSRFFTFHLWRLNQCGGVGGGGEGFAGGVFKDVVVRFASFRWWFRVCVVGRVWRGGYCRLSISFMGFGGGWWERVWLVCLGRFRLDLWICLVCGVW